MVAARRASSIRSGERQFAINQGTSCPKRGLGKVVLRVVGGGSLETKRRPRGATSPSLTPRRRAAPPVRAACSSSTYLCEAPASGGAGAREARTRLRLDRPSAFTPPCSQEALGGMLSLLKSATLAVDAPTQASSGFSNQPAPNSGQTTLTWNYAWNAPGSGAPAGALRRLHPTTPAPRKELTHVPPLAQVGTASSSRREGV